MKELRSTLLLIATALTFAIGALKAAEITGTVREVSGNTATIATEGGSPAVGDTVDIFFKLAGGDDEISVAGGKVIGQEAGAVKVQIENATGEVAKGQSVRFIAGKGDRAGSTPAPVAQSSPSPVAPAAGTGFIGLQLRNGAVPGALVFEVIPDGPGAAAGMQPNDLIVALDGSPVATMEEFVEATAKLSSGRRHALLVSRDGKLQKVEITLGARPATMPTPVAIAENVPTIPGATPATSPPPPIVAPPPQTLPTPEVTIEDEPAPSPPRTLPPSVPFPEVSPKTKPPPPPTQDAVDPAAAEFVRQGAAQYSAGNIDGAIAAYTSAIRASPTLAVAYLNRGGAYLYKPNFQAAIADANKALELKVSKSDDAYTIRGTAKAGLGDYDSAIADCNRAIKINPKNALAHNNRANNKLRKADYSGALADCNKSISLDSNSALPYYNRGFVNMNLGKFGAALSDWKKAVRMQPSFGGELNPKIQQLEARGVNPGPTTKAREPVYSAPLASTSKTSQPPEAQWTDLTNAPQKIVGTWQGGRHRIRFYADGTFVTDPHLVPNPPRAQWQIQGDRLVQYYPQANMTTTMNILSISGKELVVRDPQGNTFRMTKLR